MLSAASVEAVVLAVAVDSAEVVAAAPGDPVAAAAAPGAADRVAAAAPGDHVAAAAPGDRVAATLADEAAVVVEDEGVATANRRWQRSNSTLSWTPTNVRLVFVDLKTAVCCCSRFFILLLLLLLLFLFCSCFDFGLCFSICRQPRNRRFYIALSSDSLSSSFIYTYRIALQHTHTHTRTRTRTRTHIHTHIHTRTHTVSPQSRSLHVNCFVAFHKSCRLLCLALDLWKMPISCQMNFFSSLFFCLVHLIVVSFIASCILYSLLIGHWFVAFFL